MVTRSLSDMSKIRVGVFFGGRSAEHDISILSAKSIMQNLDKRKYEIIPIKIDRNGKFHFPIPNRSDLQILDENIARHIDVAFPALHGPYGEDGSIQGLFKSLGIAFVGSGVLGSAIAMDKDVTKRLLREAGILCAKDLVFHCCEFNRNNINYEEVVSTLGEVVFVKPANLGSSVGISKAKSKDEFFTAAKNAFHYDRKILVEEFIQGREIECAILGIDDPRASVLGEVILKSEFYSYDAKYVDGYEASLQIPADLPCDISNKIREIAIKAFKVLCCESMARIDFFLRNNSEIILNEVNTIPGFTEKSSMYPKLWEASGTPYTELLDKLVEMAMERYNRFRSN